jgi:hypothetical protein
MAKNDTLLVASTNLERNQVSKSERIVLHMISLCLEKSAQVVSGFIVHLMVWKMHWSWTSSSSVGSSLIVTKVEFNVNVRKSMDFDMLDIV